MKKSLIFALGLAAVLTACGGGDDPPPATEAVPASASNSVDGFINYLKELVAASADTLEPVDVSNVTPVLDDSAPPTVVD